MAPYHTEEFMPIFTCPSTVAEDAMNEPLASGCLFLNDFIRRETFTIKIGKL